LRSIQRSGKNRRKRQKKISNKFGNDTSRVAPLCESARLINGAPFADVNQVLLLRDKSID